MNRKKEKTIKFFSVKNRCKDGLRAHFYDEVEEQAPISVAIKSYVLKGDLASRLNFIENQLKSEKDKQERVVEINPKFGFFYCSCGSTLDLVLINMHKSGKSRSILYFLIA